MSKYSSLTSQIEILKRALTKERQAKKMSERIIEKRIHELYTNNINLNLDISNKEKLQKNLIENLVDALFVVDFKGDILEFNREALKLMGIPKKKPPQNIKEFSKVNQEKINKIFAKKIDKSEISKFDLKFYNTQKNQKYVTGKYSFLLNDLGKPYAYQVIVRDVTQQRLSDIIIREQLEIKKFETTILKQLLETDDIFENAWALVIEIAKFLKTDDCLFYGLINEQLVQMAAIGDKINGEKKIKNKLSIPIGKGIVGRVARTKKGIIISDTSMDRDYIIDDKNRLSEITVPIVFNNKIIGIIDAEHPTKDFFNESQLNVLSQISTLISLYLNNSILKYEQRESLNREKETYNKLNSIVQNLSYGKVIESTNRHIEHISDNFLKLFNIPKEKKNELIGKHCNIIANQVKIYFKEEERYLPRIMEILKKGKPVVNEILQLKNGRYINRNYTPILKNKELIAHVWGFRDYTLKKNYEISLENQNKKYKHIFGNMDLGLIELNNEQIILSVNDAFCEMYGFSSKELVGSSATKFLLKPKKTLLNSVKNNQIKNRYNDVTEIEIITKNNELKYWLVNRTQSKNLEDNIIGSILVFLDITNLKLLNNKNSDLIDSLTSRNEELSNYAHLVSHDLKTPLMTISSCLHWFKEENMKSLNSESLEYIGIINNTIKDMDKLISNTLQFAEIKLKNKSSFAIDLNSIVEELRDRKYIDTHNKFKITIKKPLPKIRFNTEKIKQVFQNLIDNSFKYRDYKKNSYAIIDWEEHKDHYLFKISDNGIGISDKYSSFIFEIFKKFKNRSDSNGLGLWIVKKIIDTSGGKIWFESELGKGTTFYFTVLKINNL